MKQRILLFVLDHIGAIIIKFLGSLCNYQVVGLTNLIDSEKAGKGVIIALWHGRMLLPVYHLRNRKISALISLHNDGEMIARVVRKLGYITRRGSPKEGGMEGFKELLSDLKHGMSVAIMPDGPTGPRHSVRDGVIHLARLSGAPIVPISYSANPRWVAKSWDRFNVMKPFSHGVIVMGQPVSVARRMSGSEEVNQARDEILRVLIEVEVEADRLMGFNREEASL
jgi:hypothetical protein